MLRAFLSYDIDAPMIRSSVQSLQEELVKTGADLKLVNPANLHFTMRFLGEISEEQKEKIIAALSGNSKPPGIEVNFVGVGAFPSQSRISVIWIGIDKKAAEVLRQEALKINSNLEAAGKFYEDSSHKEFSPHVTIARVKTGRSRDAFVSILEERKDENFGTYTIGPLRLKVSALTSAGPTYTDLHVFKE